MTKTWGPCTWYLFHTLAEKINEEHFPALRTELISIMKQIVLHCLAQIVLDMQLNL
jgi:hypothetical protein